MIKCPTPEDAARSHPQNIKYCIGGIIIALGVVWEVMGSLTNTSPWSLSLSRPPPGSLYKVLNPGGGGSAIHLSTVIGCHSYMIWSGSHIYHIHFSFSGGSALKSRPLSTLEVGPNQTLPLNMQELPIPPTLLVGFLLSLHL